MRPEEGVEGSDFVLVGKIMQQLWFRNRSVIQNFTQLAFYSTDTGSSVLKVCPVLLWWIGTAIVTESQCRVVVFVLLLTNLILILNLLDPRHSSWRSDSYES